VSTRNKIAYFKVNIKLFFMVYPVNECVKKQKIKLYYKYLNGPLGSLLSAENINSMLTTLRCHPGGRNTYEIYRRFSSPAESGKGYPPASSCFGQGHCT
jgi:hypothetical protein